jgi:RNA polymerase sigma-70 factor (ECF subfamily)
VSLNGLRKVDRHRKRERDLEDADHIGTSGAGAEPHLRDRLRAAIDELPEIYRTVFLMHDLEGFAHQEIADALDVAEGTSKARLSRARAKLRESLADIAEEYA